MAPGASTGSFGFNEAKQYPNSQNYARFEVTTDFSGSLSVPMLPTNHDLLTIDQRTQLVQIRDIMAICYLPTCVPTGGTLPQYSSAPLVALYHTYTFQIRINSQNTQFSAVFNKNADKQRSRQVLSTFLNSVRTLEVTAQRDFIDPVWQGAGLVVTLALIIEFNCFS